MHTIIKYKMGPDGLVPDGKHEKAKYDKMISLLNEGNSLNVMYELITEDHSLVQLAKIHALIRELSICTGNDFEDVKLEIKRRAGLAVKSYDGKGKKIELIKSFADCSKKELSLAIETCISIGNDFGCSLE